MQMEFTANAMLRELLTMFTRQAGTNSSPVIETSVLKRMQSEYKLLVTMYRLADADNIWGAGASKPYTRRLELRHHIVAILLKYHNTRKRDSRYKKYIPQLLS